jgi:hypothetical protein
MGFGQIPAHPQGKENLIFNLAIGYPFQNILPATDIYQKKISHNGIILESP